jgi:hypothetical protein
MAGSSRSVVEIAMAVLIVNERIKNVMLHRIGKF